MQVSKAVLNDKYQNWWMVTRAHAPRAWHSGLRKLSVAAGLFNACNTSSWNFRQV
jgi:hypothetical protein